MDRLPKRKELVFEQARKTIYLQLTTVIRSLSTKFQDTFDTENIRQLAWYLQPGSIHPLRMTPVRAAMQSKFGCIRREISVVAVEHRRFVLGKNGDGRCTKKLRVGIARLEWLRDNWDDLGVTGDLKSGYSMALKSEES